MFEKLGKMDKFISTEPVLPQRKILFTIRMASAYLGVSQSYLRKKVKSKEITYKQPEGKNGNIYFKKEWLDEWANERNLD